MRTLLAATLVLLTGCNAGMESSPPPGGVTLDVEPWTVDAGDSVTLTLRNSLAEPIGYNLCTSTLDRRAGGEWQMVPSDRACTMELRTLEPDSQATYNMEVPASVGAGEYRYRTTVHRMEEGTRLEAVSDPITVR